MRAALPVNVLVGAGGAATAEMVGMIATSAYGKPVSELSETEKQTVSALASLAAGLEGGLIGNSSADMVTAAQVGKTTVENNALANVLAAANKQKPGTIEKYQSGTEAGIKEACSGGTPVSCEMAMAAMGTILSGGVLPEAMIISGAVSAGAVGAVDYGLTGSVDPKNVIAAYWAGALTRYTGFKSTVLINAGSGAIVSSIDGKNPFLYGTIGGLGGALGYGVGNKLITPVLDDAINPVWKTLRWDDIGMGISKPSRINPVPGVSGTTTGSASGELFNLLSDPVSPLKNKSGTKNEK